MGWARTPCDHSCLFVCKAEVEEVEFKRDRVGTVSRASHNKGGWESKGGLSGCLVQGLGRDGKVRDNAR